MEHDYEKSVRGPFNRYGDTMPSIKAVECREGNHVLYNKRPFECQDVQAAVEFTVHVQADWLGVQMTTMAPTKDKKTRSNVISMVLNADGRKALLKMLMEHEQGLNGREG